MPGGHIELHFADPQAMQSAARLLDSGPGDPDALTLQVPGDGSVATIRALLNRLDTTGIDADRISIHEADLDDVFLAAHRLSQPAGAPTMSQLAYPLKDSATMLRRQLKHLSRYPAMTVLLIGMPVVFLLLFVYVFGGQLGTSLVAGHNAGAASRTAYLNFIVPGILLMTLAAAANGTAVLVAMDMTEGIIARFRTMSIARGAVLAGHVSEEVSSRPSLESRSSSAISLAFGFRPTGGPLAWLAAIGIMALFAVALAWLAVALGLAAKSVETASNTPMVLTLLPFLGSGFVTTASMPTGVRQFAQYQPFTPVTDTLRDLLRGGGPVGTHAIAAVGWSTGIALVSYLWATHLYERRPVGT